MQRGSVYAFFAFLFLSLNLSAQVPGLSAWRNPKTNGREVMRQYEDRRAIRDLKRAGRDHDEYASAYESRYKMHDLKVEGLPEYSKADLEVLFKDVRDHKPLTDDRQMQRRLTFLYPDDGCYARAEMMVDEVEKKGLELPKKVFVFGNLSARTTNHPSGWVTWWYHVAPIVASEGEVYVLDPSLDATRPLTLQQWVAAGTDPLAEVAICNSHAYDPDSRCNGDENSQAFRGIRDLGMFLGFEWARVLELGRDPEAELGNFPPWLPKETPTLP